jgi:hypothetical protein
MYTYYDNMYNIHIIHVVHTISIARIYTHTLHWQQVFWMASHADRPKVAMCHECCGLDSNIASQPTGPPRFTTSFRHDFMTSRPKSFHPAKSPLRVFWTHPWVLKHQGLRRRGRRRRCHVLSRLCWAQVLGMEPSSLTFALVSSQSTTFAWIKRRKGSRRRWWHSGDNDDTMMLATFKSRSRATNSTSNNSRFGCWGAECLSPSWELQFWKCRREGGYRL